MASEKYGNNQLFGQRVEDDIEWQSAMIGTLRLVKQHPETLFYERGRAKVIGHAYPDFIGLYGSSWMMFDVKGTRNKKIFRPETRRRHQFETLRTFSEFNKLCFFLVYWDNVSMGEVFLVTPNMKWKPKFVRGKGDAQGEGDLWFREIFNKITS